MVLLYYSKVNSRSFILCSLLYDNYFKKHTITSYSYDFDLMYESMGWLLPYS